MKVRSGDYEGAIKLFDKAINMDDENILAYFQRGRAKAGMNNFKGAIADFDTVIEFEPDYAPAYMDRAEAKKKIGDENGAKQDMDRAVKLDPSYLKPPQEIKIPKIPERPAEPKEPDKPVVNAPLPHLESDKNGNTPSPNDQPAKSAEHEVEKLTTAEEYYQRGLAKLNLGEYEN